MKIVVLDKPRENPGEIDWSALYALGEVEMNDRVPQSEALEHIRDAEIVLLNKTRLSGEMLRACPKLKMISVIATGYNTVDVGEAGKLGITVSNVPSYGSEGIGQHAVALLLEITNHVGYHDAEVRKGRRSGPEDWCFWDYPSIELENKIMGIVGTGRIGRIVARAAVAFGMKILAYDVHPDEELESRGVRYVSLDELLSSSDVISLHCPLFPETENLIDRAAIAKMKDGAILINNSRGALIDEEALAEALEGGKLYAAGLDTVREEPIRPDNPLLHVKNCFITPHISWTAVEGRQRLASFAIENVRAFLEGEPRNVVNG
ncbi:MAG: D-2-hydroxyacid dehydrogenase [Clostridia bacterium]|nr:D-2-hydroxyacid dehydrogenase [Clostridia bacterium]